MLVKQWMSDQGLSQAPLMVFSGHWKAEAAAWFASASQVGGAKVQELDISDARRTELRELVRYLQARTPVKLRAVAYITHLAELSDIPPMPPPVRWLQAGSQPLVYQPGFEDSQGAEPWVPHMMRVVHKRPLR